MKKIDNWKWAMGILFTGVAAVASFAFSLGVESTEIREIPNRLELLEAGMEALTESNDILVHRFDRHDTQIGVIYCVVEAMLGGSKPGALDCQPTEEGEIQ